MIVRTDRIILLLAALHLAACGKSADSVAVDAADRVFLNGAIYTVDEDRSWAEAVAVKDGRIVYVGDNAGTAQHIGETTEVTDLRQQMMLPGFHDSHVHILMGVMADDECNLLRIPTVAGGGGQATRLHGAGRYR